MKKTLKHSLKLTGALALFALLLGVQPATGVELCGAPGPLPAGMCTGGGPCTLAATLAGALTASTTLASTNAMCTVMAIGPGFMVQFMATQTGTNPICSFTADTAGLASPHTCIINRAEDALPVELMDFSVEEGSPDKAQSGS